MSRRLVLLILATMLPATACAYGAEEQSRTIPENRQQDLVERSATAASGTGIGRVYLQRSDATGRSTLVAVQRDIGDDPLGAVEALLEGPTADEQEAGLRSAVPRGTSLNSLRFVSTDTVRVDVSDGIFEATGDDLVSSLAQLVLTLCEISGVRRVVLVVDGVARDWPRGDGTLTDEPLTEFDYPGRATSSQPAFPGIVSVPPESG
jgi:spore germination protein GerM